MVIKGNIWQILIFLGEYLTMIYVCVINIGFQAIVIVKIAQTLDLFLFHN